jgi:hypothetical protein
VNPYRVIVPPLVHYVEALHDQRPDVTLTVVLHEFVAKHRWQQLLHSSVAPRLRRARAQSRSRSAQDSTDSR